MEYEKSVGISGKIKQKGIDIPGEIAGKIRLCKCVL